MTLVSERIEINIYWCQLKVWVYMNNFISYLYKYRLSIYFVTLSKSYFWISIGGMEVVVF